MGLPVEILGQMGTLAQLVPQTAIASVIAFAVVVLIFAAIILAQLPSEKFFRKKTGNA